MMKTIEAQVIDDTHLRLLQPIQLPKLTRVRIVVSSAEDDERTAWLRASADGLSRAYGDDEPEYPAGLIKEPNPDFGR
jgi:hypothetical protein